MSDLFRTMQAEVIAAREAPRDTRKKKQTVYTSAQAKTIWLVAAWYGFSADGPCVLESRWKVHRDTNLQEFATEEAAQKYAEELGDRWTNRQIIRIDLPVAP